MAISQKQAGQRTVPAAIISLLLGVMALVAILVSVIWTARSPIVNSFINSVSPPGTLEIPLIILAVAATGFFLGLVGLVVGCSCLPEDMGAAHARLCKWMAGTGIGISLVTILLDFGLIAILRVFLPPQ